MRKVLVPMALLGALALVSAVAALAGNGTPINTGSANALTLAVYGDAPYGLNDADTRQFEATPAFIDRVNSDPQVDLVVHVGDIHSGQQRCTEAYDQSVYDLWTAFKDPLVYTPGDNEWTDCNKSGESGGTYNKTTKQIDFVKDADGNCVDYECGNPVSNLDLVRSIFFANPGYTLGGRKKQVISQAQVGTGTDAKYVENVMWEQSQTLFVTLDLPGGSNNDQDVWYKAPTESAAQTQERTERTQADLDWLDAAFTQAQSDGVNAVVIVEQADMWDLDGKPGTPAPNHIAAYKPFIDSIASHTLAFDGDVLLFNGDSHSYRSDNPLVNDAPCVIEQQPPDGGPAGPCLDDAYDNQSPNGVTWNVPNFHRVVVHGDNQATDAPLEWLKLTDDPRAANDASATSFGPFSWTREIGPTP